MSNSIYIKCLSTCISVTCCHRLLAEPGKPTYKYVNNIIYGYTLINCTALYIECDIEALI